MIRIATAAPAEDDDDDELERKNGDKPNRKNNNPNGENDGPPHEELITPRQFAGLLKVSLRTLWRLVSTGMAPEPIKLHGSTRWVLSEVMKWIRAGCPPQAKAKQ